MFKDDNYLVIKRAISEELANFCYDYFLTKRKVARTFYDSQYISQFNEDWGVWNDSQVPETYSHYSDIVMETLLEKLLPRMEAESGFKLCPTYSYARIYKKGDVLKRHKDRKACSVSTTMNLGGDPWPIFINPNQNEGVHKTQDYVPSNSPGVKVELKPGDMLIYSGCDLEHWREPFEGDNNAQVFLHYNNKSEPNARAQKFDTRMHLGLPSWFKGKTKEDFK